MRLIFRRYLEVGSIRDLAEDLDRQGIRTRRQTLPTPEAAIDFIKQMIDSPSTR